MDKPLLLAQIFVAVDKKRSVAVSLQRLLNAHNDGGGEGRNNIGNDDPDHLGGPAAKIPGDVAGTVVQQFDNPAQAGAGLLAHQMGLAVDVPGNGGPGYAGCGGNVVDGDPAVGI